MSVSDYVSIERLSVGDTVYVIFYSSFPALPAWDRDRRTFWYIDQRRGRKVPSYGATMFGGTIAANDTTTGTLTINGSPNALEGVHHTIKPGAGSVAHGGSFDRVGMLELPYQFIKRAFRIIDNPDHPGERPTGLDQLHAPKQMQQVALYKR